MRKTLTLLLIAVIFLFCHINFAQAATTTVSFTTSGSWVAPAGVTNISVEAWGAGAGGAGNSSDTVYGQAGGGGGAYSKLNGYTVTPGSSYSYTVGVAGTAGPSAGAGAAGAGGQGGSTNFINNTTLSALGGLGGSIYVGGLGATSTGGFGDVKFNGGNGGTGNTPTVGSGGGGGAGGSANNGGAGGNGAAGPTAGVAGAGGATGGGWGAPGVAVTGGGNTATTTGAGGSGAYVGSTANQAGGAGAAGLVMISYVVVTTQLLVSQEGYIFEGDDATTTGDTNSQQAAASTSITSVKKGERLTVRLQLKNTGAGTVSSSTYGLFYDRGDGIFTKIRGSAVAITTTGNCTDTNWNCNAVDTSPAVGEYTSLALDKSGVPWVSYRDGTNADLRVAKFVGSGGSGCSSAAWTCTSIDTTGTVGQHTSIAFDASGTPWVSYDDYSTFNLKVATYVGTGGTGCASTAWQCTTVDSTGFLGLSSSIAFDSTGKAWVSYYDTTGHDLRVAKYVGSGGTGCSSAAWTCTAVDTTNDVGNYTSITFDSLGNAWVSYYDTTNADLRVATYVGTGGTGCAVSSWTCTAVDITNDVGSFTSIAFDPAGNAWVSYQDATNMDLKVAKYVGSSSGVGNYNSIAIGTDGFPIISYYDASNGNLMFGKCSNVSCSSFATSTLDAGGDVGLFTTLAIASDGNPLIAYYDNTYFNLNLTRCFNISCTSFSTSTIDAGGSTGYAPSINIGIDGFAVIAYAGNNGLAFAKCNNVTCTSSATSTLDLGSSNPYPSLSIGTDGYPIMSYWDNNLKGASLAKCSNLSCTSVATTSVTRGGTGTGNASSLAIGTDGFPLVVSYDGSNDIITKCSSVDCRTAASSSANLPTTASDLDTYLDDVGYTNVAANDSIFDSISGATSSVLAYNFTKHNVNNTDQITATWIGQVSLATSTYLQVYDNTLATWVGFATNTTPTANTNFTLTTTLTTNLSNYYYASFNIAVRVVTGTTTRATTLKTDQIVITLGASGSANQTLLHYRWRQDDGSETAANYSAGEDIPIAASDKMFKGDRKRLRLTVSNAGTASASNITYRLEYASSSCTSWLPVPSYNSQTTEEWVTDLSQYIPEGAATTHSSGMSVPPGKTFTAGEARLFTNQTGAISLTTAQSTELEFGIRSTSFVQPNLLYCFRLTNAGSITNFIYSVQPQATLNGNPRPQSGGVGIETTGSGPARAGGGQGGGAPVDPPAVVPPVGGGGQGGGGGDSG